MTERLFEADSYLVECAAKITAVEGDRVALDRTVFYPLGGGQPGDTGELVAADGRRWHVIDTRKDRATGDLWHQLEGDEIPAVGTDVTARPGRKPGYCSG